MLEYIVNPDPDGVLHMRPLRLRSCDRERIGAVTLSCAVRRGQLDPRGIGPAREGLDEKQPDLLVRCDPHAHAAGLAHAQSFDTGCDESDGVTTGEPDSRPGVADGRRLRACSDLDCGDY